MSMLQVFGVLCESTMTNKTIQKMDLWCFVSYGRDHCLAAEILKYLNKPHMPCTSTQICATLNKMLR